MMTRVLSALSVLPMVSRLREALKGGTDERQTALKEYQQVVERAHNQVRRNDELVDRIRNDALLAETRIRRRMN